jgi:EAL domain-containing protein (putative c-di-GMP-specific phosphodiesterase class I)
MVPPSEFVNFAEQIGRIGFITRWVLQQAMEIVAQQRKAGTPLQISVNISAIDLADEGFVDQVTQLAASTGAQPCDIKLEITESAAMEEPVRAMAAMQRLHDLGFNWSLDDFGTGYSSLSYLQKMPLSELKVDRAFVRDVTPDSDAAKLLGSVIALGHQLGLTVVAEGAETRAEWELLRTLGADMVQGWYAAKAMPLPDFLQWCKVNPKFGV